MDATIRYLRFPLSPDHRAPLQDGRACPHCAARHIQKWGTFSGRQRYRCCGCGRTFSTFTATALHSLKRPDRWRRFLWCHDGRLSVRASAAVVRINKNTALRWRHRLLEQWRQSPGPKLQGRVIVREFTMPESQKGTRATTRPARHRAAEFWWGDRDCPYVAVLAAWSRPRSLVLKNLGPTPIPLGQLRDACERYLTPRTGTVTELVNDRGPYHTFAQFARQSGLSYTREHALEFPPQIRFVRLDLRRWLAPFRGVATRRLDNYLEWFRRQRVQAHQPHPDQQFPRTKPQWNGSLRWRSFSPLLYDDPASRVPP